MATAARKARKRAGIPFTKEQKIPTPPEKRSYVIAPVHGAETTKYQGATMARSQKKIDRFLDRFAKQD